MGSLNTNSMSTAEEASRPRPTFSQSEPRNIYRTARAFENQFDDDLSASGNRRRSCTKLSASSSSTPSKRGKQSSKNVSSLSAEGLSAQQSYPIHDSDSDEGSLRSPARNLFQVVANQAKPVRQTSMGTGNRIIKTPSRAIPSLPPATITPVLPYARTGVAERAAEEDTHRSVDVNTDLNVSSGCGASG